MSPTKKQQQILEALVYLSNRGESPTVREVAKLVGLSSPATVQKHLKMLEAEGHIEMSGKSRGIRLVKGFGIPVVGRVAAGEPLENPEYAESEEDDDPRGAPGLRGFPEVAVDPRVFHGSAQPGELVALSVEGDSMVDAGVLDGDLVVIRRQPTVEEGEIAAVTIDGAGTLKRWSRPTKRGQSKRRAPVRLLPANERFEPIVIREADHQEVRVFGKYLGLIRGENIRMV